MTTKQLSLHCKTWGMLGLAGGALTMASCAQDDLTGEKFDSGVYNTQLEAPSVDDITITPNSDGTVQTIAWPVVDGAGGYHAILKNLDNDEILKDTLIDGISFTAKRMEDTNYQLSLAVLDNEEKHNKGTEAVEKAFNTFTTSFQTIPAGDLATYFKENPVPEDAITEMLYYDLQPGGEYTLSENIDFRNKRVALRTPNGNNHAKITYTGKVSIKTGTLFTLKYVDIDASQSENPVIALSETPDENIKGLKNQIENNKETTKPSNYYNILGAITINGCNITGVNNNLVYDSNVKYCLESLIINNSTIHLTLSSNTNISGNAVIYFKGGYANTLQVANSTFWNTGDADAKYFVQYNNDGRAVRGGYTNSWVNFLNSTFYNIAKAGQWANYGGFNGQKCSCFDVEKCIFVDCGNKQVIRRILGGRGPATYATAITNYNTYMFNGEFESTGGIVETYDLSGTAIEEDPSFKDAANGDFTVSGAAQIANKTGDPRWLPSAE